jgi:hypothetical protein
MTEDICQPCADVNDLASVNNLIEDAKSTNYLGRYVSTARKSSSRRRDFD